MTKPAEPSDAELIVVARGMKPSHFTFDESRIVMELATRLEQRNAEMDDLLGLLREMPKRSDCVAAGILWVVKRNRALAKYSDVSEE